MKRILLLTLAVLTAWSVTAQTESTASTDSDVRMRVGVGASAKLGRFWKISLEEELRMKDNFGALDRINSTLGIAYKPVEWLKIEPQYTLIALRDDGKSGTSWKLRHRVALDLTGAVRFGRWALSLRERPQVTIRTDSLNPMEKVRNQFVLRSRLKASYTFPAFALKPYAYVELTNTLNTPDRFEGQTGKDSERISYKRSNYISNIRYCIGAEYRFNRRSSMDVFYRLDTGHGYDTHITGNKGYLKSITKEPYMRHVIGLYYHYAF